MKIADIRTFKCDFLLISLLDKYLWQIHVLYFFVF